MIVALTVLIAGLCLLLYLVFAYSFLVPAPPGLPILMYHKVSEDRADSLTVKGADAGTAVRLSRQEALHDRIVRYGARQHGNCGALPPRR